MSVCLITIHIKKFVSDNELVEMFPMVRAAHETLNERTGAGKEFLGWLDLPINYDIEDE